MRFFSPAQTRRRLTEKRSLWLRCDGKAQSGPRPQGTPHGKAHSARWASRKSALWPRPRDAPHQKTHSGGFGARRMRLYVTSNPRMRFSVKCAFPHLRKRGVGSRKSAFWQTTSRKSALWQPLPHGKAHPARRASRKGALWPRPGGAPHQKAHSGGSGARRMRLYVTSNPRMRFSVKCAFPHLGKRGAGSRKSAFWQVSSRKSALCALGLTEKRSLACARRAHLTEKRTLHMTAHSTSPSGTVELYKPGDRSRAPSAPRLPPVACATM